jgi:hypothetical protein
LSKGEDVWQSQSDSQVASNDLKLNKIPNTGILLDSGATDMIFPSSKGLQNYFPISNGTLTLADKITTLKIIGRGNYDTAY